MQSNRIFRQVSLDRLSSPEQLDEVVRVTTPKSWLALLALLALLITAVIWGIIGRIPVEVAGPAILINNGGVKNIVSVESGQITALHIEPGQLVEEGELIAEMMSYGAVESIPVISSFNGRILELKADVGQLLDPGTSLASLEFVGAGIEQQVVMYVSPVDGKRIQPGMPVKIAPITTQVEEHGFLMGEISSVSDFPATDAGILRLLGSEELMQALGINGAPIEVHIALVPDSQSTTGYQWTSSAGPDFTLSSGTLASAKIMVDSRRPIHLVLPLN